ncbi:hypothetical protein RU86_GL002199 [Lactococcus piscium]|uniref:Gram-positive cocci surface proteins LPxTG domain-containing protein n=1 Tax=Pseudolactococcus piscium TaxID=1364 RepID=A0A2A5S0Q0_9LACT|nr:LPXTG cell wall anchor domain-containing protein [Lactococcus piscium]PCS07087.1 hypothetical protein RU86_GL002199 [Lactococcus piscium]
MINGDSGIPEKPSKNVNNPALPSTGESDGANLSIFGGGTLLSILGALFLRRKNKKG